MRSVGRSPEQRRLASQIRQYERETFKIPVHLKIMNKRSVCFTHNISPEGLLLFADTNLTPGIPVNLKFTFGENICSLNISGRVLFCRSVFKEGSKRHAMGIKFAAIRDFEKSILISAVHDLRQHPETLKKSSLSILVSADTLAQEAADLSVVSFEPSNLEKDSTASRPPQVPPSDRRIEPRMATNLSFRLLSEEVKGSILNISQTGFCLASEKPIPSGTLLLSVNLSPLGPQQSIDFSAEVLSDRGLYGDKFLFGARYSPLNAQYSRIVTDSIFENYAKKASSIVKNDESLKIKIEDFFNREVKQFQQDLSDLYVKSQGPESKSAELEKRITELTDELLLKGYSLEKEISNDVYMKRVKQEFREIAGCWFYKSPIMKMGYEKPRGYPGDYRLFELIYDNHPLSEDNFGFQFDKYFLNNTYTRAVRSRKDKMKGILKDFIESRTSSLTRLLNVACGGSKEIRELFSEQFIYGKRINFTGLDNDERALELSKASLNYLPPNVQARFLKENVLSLFRDEKYYDIIGKQDIIYILGLTEYLPDRIFKRLIQFLFNLLDGAGKLVITYKDKNIPLPSIPPDWLCDWAFVKRTEQDLVNAATVLGSKRYSLKIEREETGCIMFLILTKT